MLLPDLPEAVKDPCDDYPQQVFNATDDKLKSNQLLRALEQHVPTIAHGLYVSADSLSKILILEGKVPTYYKKQIIYKICRQIIPEFSVVDRLMVAPLLVE